MTFFYDLNKKIADLSKPAEQLNERSEKWIQKAVDPSHKGDLHKALHVAQGEKIPKGKIEKATHSKNAHLRHMAQFAKNVAKEDAVEEGFVDTVKQGAQAALGAIGQTLGHGSDEDMIKDLQKKAGVPVTGKVQPQQPGQQPQGQQPMAEDDMDEAMFPGSKIGDKLRSMKQSIGHSGSAKFGMAMAPAAGAGAAAGAAMQAGGAALFAPALGAGALGGAAAALGGFLTYKGLNWLAQKLFGTKEEALEFATAHLKAANAGQPQFTFQGKTYPVKIKSPEEAQELYYKVKNLQSQIHEGTLDEEGGVPMTPKQKAFAKLAPPADKITFADKIAGAKKEVDEMLGDVAAEAMKNALVGGQKKLDKNKNGRLDAQDFEMLRKGAGKSEEMDEDWDDMLKDVEKRRSKMKTGEKVQGHKGEIEKTDKGIKHTRRYDDKTGETDTGDDDTPKGEKRRGRPKGTGKAMGAKGPSGKSKLMTKETDHDSNELKHAMAVLKKAGYKISKNKEELDEKAVSKAQQRFMGMAHAMQKGEKIPGASKELKKVAKTMKKGDVEDYAATKHKGLPEKKKKKEDVEETTTSGSVATATEAPKSKGKGGFTFGKGIYDSMNRDLENMISESMNVSVNMTMDDQGQPHKNITVSAEGEAAEQLAQLLNLAGLQGAAHDDHSCPTCNQAPCGCSEMVDENAPDWPTNTEVGGEDDPHLHMYAGGLNKPKETGQTTVPVVNRDPRRGSFGPAESPADVKESKDLGMKLYHELKSFKG